MRPRTTLSYKTYSTAPGYRDLVLRAVGEDGNEYELRLTPANVQSVIYACAEVSKQIGVEPPIDWDLYPTTVHWPSVTPWKSGSPPR